LAYVYRLEGYDRGWRWIRERRVEYVDLPLGEYRFQVKAVDQELNDSEMAEVRVMVVPDPRIVGLTEALRAGGVSGEFVGKSLALQQLLAQVHEVAQTDLTVLILGETGTGKGLVVRAIHGLSARREGPFIQVNCGTIPEGLVESELFGHEKGAFTGAVTRKLGRVELAEGGTFFLDEIGDLALATQVKLLRFLEERTFERVGGERTLRGNVRVIAATNRELRRMVAEGQFREDLYFRLLEFSIRVPPLRERLEDIPLLVRYFAERFARHLRRPVPGITAVALKRLQRYPWPGNVRELEHLVQRAVLSCREDIIGLDDVSWVLVEEREPSKHRVFVPLEEYERRYLEEVLEATGWVIYGPQGAAQILGIDPEKLRGRMRRYGLRRPR
jgi:formate hydrogenlyase transcriptional activator